jgi:hypothetical protein
MATQMKKQIVLKSFSALSFDVIIRQAPVRALHNPPPRQERRPAPTQGGDLPVEARSPVDSAKADGNATTGRFPDREHPVVHGINRAAWRAPTLSPR